MKAIKYIVLLAAFLPLKSIANTDSTAKAYFYVAKHQLEDMLTGNQEMSYEEAIYQIENAWKEGGINSSSYQTLLNAHIKNIKALIKAYTDSVRLNPTRDLLETSLQKKEKYEKAVSNYCIYRYMTENSLWTEDGEIFFQSRYRYSTKDPMGTGDWTNTQVTHLLDDHTGNCFALASLFYIFSERLQSEAHLCTAPGHIYIRHADDKGIRFNVELSSKNAFPGTGTLETLTYTTDEATKKGIALRELDLKQSIALCLVYLAKGYEYKFGTKDDPFIIACAETALQYDELNLNAMLLKAEVMESSLVKQNKTIKQLSSEKQFQDYQHWITHIFSLGYREMPFEMKNIMIKGWTRDTVIKLAQQDHTPQRLNHPTLKDTRYAGLSWGLFDEEIKTKPSERFGNTVYDTKSGMIIGFLKDDILYNHYNFDPVVFAWNVDPLAHKMPSVSPYAFCANNPISMFDPDGAFPYSVHVRSFAPFETFGGGFEGDNRRYSTVLGKAEIGKSGVTSRVQQSFTMNTDTRSIYGLKTWSDPSYHPLRGTKTAKDQGAISNFKSSKASNGNEVFSFTSTMAGANPLVPGSPDIDVKTNFTLMEDKKLGKLYVGATMTGDRFPAAETFIGDTKGQQLFIGVSPYDGNPYTSLPGNNDRSMMSSSFEININDKGEFTGVQQGDKTYTIEQWNGAMQSKPIEYKAPTK